MFIVQVCFTVGSAFMTCIYFLCVYQFRNTETVSSWGFFNMGPQLFVLCIRRSEAEYTKHFPVHSLIGISPKKTELPFIPCSLVPELCHINVAIMRDQMSCRSDHPTLWY